jgi:hypothetical protein
MNRFPMVLMKGLIKFWKPKQKATSARQGQCFFYCGQNGDKFAAEFGHFGCVRKSNEARDEPGGSIGMRMEEK